ncbi:MBL fold metallo-hydrolase [Cellulomonas chengniuliangii]|uniref:MBL fold metallo-hydrolase n=1 Tax=Cellulomonas chengniuliangii TaxID=2968084 RepID=A0ABY5KUE9_9CELL|nr:MBL fold metallo-hydrolase [Cellulomonas chengniuliangii]MCC2309117.1 MBL fold metallo-hydrolase [Cellulomonas chengniuliangii]MCC2319260.1 MBL fold metallo-hydrolase [Cellulomonas chengniuliangii]UUI74162.1 MBL fold metallo-hydrolase [Cellulomonas chengniuliangii]
MTPGLRITWLGHASAVLDLDGARVLTDPLLRRHAGLLRRLGVTPRAASWEDPDAVLVSHLHHDHAELGSLRLVRDAPVLSAPANAAWLRRRGIPGSHGLPPGRWWQAPGSEVRVRTTRAVHGERPMPHRPNAATGFLVSGPSATVWFAGDTGPFPEMADLAAEAGRPIDVALVPVGGWGPRLSGGHLGPVEAARACALAGASFAMPIHWGTLHAPAGRRLPPGWMERAGAAFAVALERTAPGCTALVLQPGEAVEVPVAH